MTLPELAIRRPVTTFVLLVSMVVIGAIALSRLPLAYMPDVDERSLFVIVEYPNASPKAIERLIVQPLEDALGSINGINNMWSNADTSGCRVNLNFDWHVNVDLIRTEIRERIDRTREELPEDIQRITISSNWNPRVSGETIMEARLASGRDLSKDYELLDRKIIKPLERIPGVAAVLLDGVNPREIKINVSRNALARHNIDPRDVMASLRNNNMDTSLGVVRNEEYRYALRAVGAFQSLEEIKALPIKDGALRLADIAEITYKEPPLEYGRHLDGNFAMGVSIAKEPTANTVEVCDAVRERVAALADDPALEGINFLVWDDQGREITKTIDDLKETGMFGAILASIVLFLFLRRLSTTAIAVTCIPFSLVVACGVIWANGKTMNTVTLLGLIVGVGMLVDNAVVVMENIERYRQKGLKSKVAALLGAREVSIAVIAATLTSIIVFLPMIFAKPSEMNIILKELAITVCITLIASLFVSQTLIPLAAGKLRSAKEARPDGRVMNFLKNSYASALAFSMAHPVLGGLAGALVVGSMWYPAQKVEMNLETNNAEMFISTNYHFSENLSLAKKEEICSMVEEALVPHMEELKIKSTYSWFSSNWTMTRVYMEDNHTNEAHMNEVRKRLPTILPKIAGVRMEVMDNVRPWQRNRGKRVAFQLSGADSETLTRLSEVAKRRLERVPNLFDHYTSAETGSNELHATIDRNRAREYNIDMGRPAEVVELTFRGRRLPRFQSEDGEIEMRFTIDETEDGSLDQLKALPFRNENGEGSVPLESFTQFAMVKAPDRIQRNNKTTNVWVGARYSEGKKEDHVAAARAALEGMELPYGYRWDFQGSMRDRAESQREFFITLLLALGLIFAVMAGLFESILQAVALMISLPFALTGAAWTLYLTGIDLDQPASVGLLFLLGIVVNNGIVMVEHFNGYRRAGMPRRQAMLRGGKERLRPILMTTLTTLVGLIPMAVQQPALGGVYYYSMAFVILGGLIVSTIMTPLLLPTAICILEDMSAWIGRVVFRRQTVATQPQPT